MTSQLSWKPRSWFAMRGQTPWRLPNSYLEKMSWLAVKWAAESFPSMRASAPGVNARAFFHANSRCRQALSCA